MRLTTFTEHPDNPGLLLSAGTIAEHFFPRRSHSIASLGLNSLIQHLTRSR